MEVLTVELSYIWIARTLNLPGLYLWHWTLVFPIMYCLNGILATQYLPLLLQRLTMISITSKERGEFGSVAHIKVTTFVSLQPSYHLTNYNISKTEMLHSFWITGYGYHEDSVKVFHVHLTFLGFITKVLNIMQIFMRVHSVYGKLN